MLYTRALLVVYFVYKCITINPNLPIYSRHFFLISLFFYHLLQKVCQFLLYHDGMWTFYNPGMSFSRTCEPAFLKVIIWKMGPFIPVCVERRKLHFHKCQWLSTDGNLEAEGLCYVLISSLSVCKSPYPQSLVSRELSSVFLLAIVLTFITMSWIKLSLPV